MARRRKALEEAARERLEAERERAERDERWAQLMADQRRAEAIRDGRDPDARN
ncbi:MAG: hypothetical protein Q8P22_05095 [Chloroflexota bacterium]|nr:hypothetical protein [Chloroflexota bacterium]